jgi:hypothetical protein
MKLRRRWIVHGIDLLPQARFCFGRTLEQEKKMIEAKIVRDRPAIVRGAKGGVLPSRVTRRDSSMGAVRAGFGASAQTLVQQIKTSNTWI